MKPEHNKSCPCGSGKIYSRCCGLKTGKQLHSLDPSKIPWMMQTAIQLFQTGQKQQPESLCQQVLAINPDEINALHLTGVIAHQAGRHNTAIKYINKAIRINPNVPEFHNSLGNALCAKGNHKKAINCYKKSLLLNQESPLTHINIANAYLHTCSFTEAISHYTYALALKPGDAMIYYYIGKTYQKQGNLDQAAENYKQALELQPGFAEANNNLGVVYENNGSHETAIKHFKRALCTRPEYSEAHCNLGNLLKRQGHIQEALNHYESALKSNTNIPEIYYNTGVAHQELGNLDKAIENLKKAVYLKEDYVEALTDLGNAFYIKRELDKAESVIRKAITINSAYALAHNNLGSILASQERHIEAIKSFTHAFELNPGLTETLRNKGASFQAIGRYLEAVEYFKKAILQNPDFSEAHSNLLLLLNCLPGVDPAENFEEHLRFSRQHETPLQKSILPHTNDRTPNRPLRIGYVSPDFRTHSVAYFIEPVLALHDHSRFEIFCYYNYGEEDDTTRRLKSLADHWRPIAGLSDDKSAQLIRDDHIDLLVDLSGHTPNNRLLVFARKPAPIQITWIGYPNTTGLMSIDYRLTDTWADPSPRDQRLYTETLVHLTDCFLCYQASDNAPDITPLPAIQTGHITFGSFNNLNKISSDVIALWTRIINCTTGSRLLIKNKALTDDSIRRYYSELFIEHDIKPAQFELVGWLPDRNAHMDLYNRVDIALDTFPYNGTTTTCEAMWMGIPTITLAGQTHASRVGSSLLGVLDMTELVAETEDEYVEMAAHLASQPERLAALRTDLRERMASSPLTDANLFTRNLEQTYQSMWKKWCDTSN